MEKLRDVYYPDPTNGTAVRDGNIALTTNLNLTDSTLQSIALQANANGKSGLKNTFLFRFVTLTWQFLLACTRETY